MVAFMADKQKSSSKGSGAVKKVTPSPSVRTLMDNESGDTSPVDKKRNKLGYHRTAVACGHCRRRKIRCIPSSDTTSARCQNCIRLKKDCQFFPVEQTAAAAHPPPSKRPRSESKGDVLNTELENSVSSSSPRLHTGGPAMSVDQYEHFRAPVETTAMSQGPDHEYPHAYDNRHWYQTESQPHAYWLQHDPNHPHSFAPSPYPITPTTTAQPITSQEHAYTYPAISLEHSSYGYPIQRARDGSMNTQPNAISGFGGYRANTLPERMSMPEDAHRSHDLHPTPMALPSQHLMGPPFQPVHNSPPQYAPSAPHQVWLPANSEPRPHPANYIQSGPSPPWYNHPDGLAGTRDNVSHSHNHDPASQDPNRFRPKPG